MDLVLILIILLLLFGSGGSFYAFHTYGPVEGSGVLLIALIICMFVWVTREERN